MSENRVKRWREAKREHGLKAVTIWLSETEELRLKDIALQRHCSPSAVVQQALAQLAPPRPQENSNHTDTLLLRQLIREELAAMQETPSPVSVGITVTTTDTSTQFQPDDDKVAMTEIVTETVTDSVTETSPHATDKPAIVARLRAMRDEGMSLQQMATQLQAEGVPTLSGKGQWQKGTVDKLLHTV